MDDSQLLKGILEGCVLSVIARGESYGYEILADLEKCGFDNLLEGTLYPVLTRLEKKGYLSCRKGKSPYGPVRKYYSISLEGRRYLDEFRISYEHVMAAASKALAADGRNETTKGEREKQEKGSGKEEEQNHAG